MANVKDLTIDVTARLTVSDDTAERCLRLLEMWQADNPDKQILGEWIPGRGTVFRIAPRPLSEPAGGDGE